MGLKLADRNRHVTTLSEICRTYEEFLKDVGRKFEMVRNIFIDRMQCRKGCSSCCSQLFSIIAIEAAYIPSAIKQLEPGPRGEMREKARTYLQELIGVEIDATLTIEQHSEVVKPALEALIGRYYIPCPALKDDACTIYDHRPIIARKYGIPLWNPNKPNILQACELNFKPGEVFEGEGLVEPQVELAYRWLEFKTKIHEELDLPDVVATVASAILFDYEALLEHQIGQEQKG